MLWMTIVMLLLDGALFYFTPNLSRSTVPLGVNLPSGRVDEPVVREALRRFRIGCVVVTVTVIFGAWLTRAGASAAVLWVLAQIAALVLVYAVCRRPIQFAKRSGQWYADVPVRVGAEVLRAAPRRRPAWAAHGLAWALTIAGVIVLAAGYNTLPDRYPTHWNLAGQADGWTSKSWPAVLAPAVVGVIAVTLIAALASILSRRRDPLLPDGNPAAAQVLRDAIDRAIQRGLGLINVVTALIWTFVALAPLLGLHGTVLAVCVWLAITIAAVATGWIAVVSVRAQSRFRSARPVADAPDSPDDDRFWKLGIVYYNRDDPSLLVPKRAGTGFTVNAGRPAGMAFWLGSVAVLIVTVGLLVL